MSQRAAWQLERLGFVEVYDFVLGKAHWLASGRPTVQQEATERVGDFVTKAPTAQPDDLVADVLARLSDIDDVVVIDERSIVLGRVTSVQLRSSGATTTMAGIMKLGPTTIRPDERTYAVRKRMKARGVSAILVTRPTGVLLGQYVPQGEEP
jgi:CBS domain-containing protein